MTDHADITVQRILTSERFRLAAATLAAEHDRTVADIIRLTEIEAPSFTESTRARTWHDMAKAHGLTDLEIDAEGNVTGVRRGVGNGPLVCVAAHLDTVFPAGTNVKVRREGTKLFAPGVGDDTRSLAVLLAWLRAMDAAGIETRADILFVADVGEEGLGDLRGMRHLFQRGRYKDRISAFITVDSPNMERIVTGGVGSKRYRVTFKAPGGHSYGSFGVVNPMFAMADAISRLGRVPVPDEPKTTYSASVTGGGTSINSIPNAVWTEFDLRSESVRELRDLEQRFLSIIRASVTAENEHRSTRNGPVMAEILPIGDRPADIPASRTNSCNSHARRSAPKASIPHSAPPPPTPTSPCHWAFPPSRSAPGAPARANIRWMNGSMSNPTPACAAWRRVSPRCWPWPAWCKPCYRWAANPGE